MKKLNTILITSMLLLGASGVQAKLSDSDIASGVQVSFDLRHWNTNYNNHPGKYGKQYNLLEKIFFLKKKIKKLEQKLSQRIEIRSQYEHLGGVNQHRVDKARRNFNHLRAIGASDNEMQLASDVLDEKESDFNFLKIYEAKLLNELNERNHNIYELEAKLTKLNKKLQKMQARDGVLNMRTRTLDK